MAVTGADLSDRSAVALGQGFQCEAAGIELGGGACSSSAMRAGVARSTGIESRFRAQLGRGGVAHPVGFEVTLHGLGVPLDPRGQLARGHVVDQLLVEAPLEDLVRNLGQAFLQQVLVDDLAVADVFEQGGRQLPELPARQQALFFQQFLEPAEGQFEVAQAEEDRGRIPGPQQGEHLRRRGHEAAVGQRQALCEGLQMLGPGARFRARSGSGSGPRRGRRSAPPECSPTRKRCPPSAFRTGSEGTPSSRAKTTRSKSSEKHAALHLAEQAIAESGLGLGLLAGQQGEILASEDSPAELEELLLDPRCVHRPRGGS